MKGVPSVIIRVGLIVALALPLCSLAQEGQWEKEGELENVEIEIVRERQITLPRANRNFDKVPPRPAEPIKPEITYDFKNLHFKTPDFIPGIRPLRLKQEELAKVYGSYVSTGYGNYASPYLDAWLNSKRDKNKFYGLHFFHESFGKGPVDDNNSASGNTEVRVFGKAFAKNISTGGFVNYENRNGYFYGYTPGLEVDRDTIRQNYKIVSLGGDFSNSTPSDFDFKLGGTFSYLTDNYLAVESEVGLSLNSAYHVSETSKINLESDYALIARKDLLIDAKPRHLLSIRPAFQFSPIDNLSVTLGANAVLENDTIRTKNLHFYPNLKAQYQLSNSIVAYASLTGDMDKVSLHSLSAENMWLDSNIGIFHTNRTVEFSTGLNGKLGRRMAFNIGFSGSNLKDWYFYQNDSVDRSKFVVVYDQGNTQRVNFFGEVGYNHAESVRLSLRGDYLAYATDQIQDAWHRPLYKLKFNSSFNIYSKIVLNVDVAGLGGMKAFDPETSGVVSLDPALDLNVKLDYYLSRQISIFVQLNNLLSSEYPLYLHYPVRGFQAKAGLTWSF